MDASNIFGQGFDFHPGHLIAEILLTVEIGGFDPVEIGDEELAESRSGQGDRDIGAQSAGPGDSDDTLS
jgi:hypothetical protein